jgi:hypothetical protein
MLTKPGTGLPIYADNWINGTSFFATRRKSLPLAVAVAAMAAYGKAISTQWGIGVSKCGRFCKKASKRRMCSAYHFSLKHCYNSAGAMMC